VVDAKQIIINGSPTIFSTIGFFDARRETIKKACGFYILPQGGMRGYKTVHFRRLTSEWEALFSPVNML
jgi:hypothetical protein